VRLLRVAKIPFRRKLIDSMSDNQSAATSVVKFLLVLWVINHYVACGWYAMGDLGLDPNWLDVAFTESDSLWYRYTTSYHWSLTQFTPASMEVVPTNAWERTFTCGAIFFGLVMFTSFVSHMTNAVKRLQEISDSAGKQRRDLSHYISYHRIPYTLGKTITDFVKTESRRMRSKRLLEADISAFRVLPENLLNKMHQEVYSPVLCNHPFFRKVQEAEPAAFVSICNLACGEKNILVGEELFRFGQKATKMYFATSGELAYFKGAHRGDPELVCEGSWFSEATLWCRWSHRGRMMSSFDVAELVHLDAAEFRTIISATASSYEVQRYARIYCWKAVDDCGGTTQITDIWGGPQKLVGAVRHAWRPSPLCIVNQVAMMLWQSTDEWYLITFQAWKEHTSKAVAARLKAQSLFLRCFFPRRRADPHRKRFFAVV